MDADTFVVVILAICVTIGILALYAIGALPYITLTSIFITLALWVKYCMLSIIVPINASGLSVHNMLCTLWLIIIIRKAACVYSA